MDNNTLNKFLVLFNRLLYLYRHLSKITSENTILSIKKGLDFPKSNITGFYQGMSLNTNDYLDFGNSLLTNYESMLRKIIDECKTINDEICDSFNIANKMEIGFVDIQKLFKNKLYKSLFTLLYENLKYLVENLESKDEFLEKEFESFDEIMDNLEENSPIDIDSNSSTSASSMT